MTSSPGPLEAGYCKPLKEVGFLLDLALWPAGWFARRTLPRGRQTVMVVPGFLTGDTPTLPLRLQLGRLGHRVHGWGLGINHGRVRELLPLLGQRAQDLAEREGQPVHLVGWSLGGLLAREVARDDPRPVAQVLTLGTPVVGGPKYTTAAAFYRRQGHDLDELERAMSERAAERPLGVPVTALYSRADGIVCPAACIDPSGHTEHVQTRCTHGAFVFSPEVVAILAERLADRQD